MFSRPTRRALIQGLSVALLPVSAKAVGEDFEPVRRRIGEAVSSGEATGIAVAVTRGDRILWEEGFGWADQALGRKVTSHTPFCLASITKPFTTTVLMTLAAEGKLSLDDPASRYFRGRAPRGPNGDPGRCTLRRIGAHASGLPTIFEMFIPGQEAKPPSTDDLLRDYGALAFPPGEIYDYNNIGYAMLGAIASQVTDRDFAALMRERLLEPLALRDSFYGTDAERLGSRALQYEAAGKVLPYYTTTTPPSGELYVSAHDLARFALFNLGHRPQGAREILDGRHLAELQAPVFTGPSGAATSFGWFRDRTRSGLEVIYKDGGQPGVAATLYMVPSRDSSCLVLTNRSDNYKLIMELVSRIMATLIPDWDTPEGRPEAPFAPFIASDLAGRWEGRLINGGADMPVVLEIADEVSLALGNAPAEKVTGLKRQAGGFVGNSRGRITAAEALRTGADSLALKLMLQEEKLVGRILATAEKPGTMLPYVLNLARKV